MPSQNSPSGRPEIPPDIPPEFVDAYLAGFQRGYGGEVEPGDSEPMAAREREVAEGLDELDRPRDDTDHPTIEPERPINEHERLPDEVEVRGLDELDRPTETPDGATETPDQPAETSGRPERDRQGRKGPTTDRPEDMMWLFERDRDAPLGWAFNPADETSEAGEVRSKRMGTGSTSTAIEASAEQSEARNGRSPWVVLIGFLAILVVLMLVAYIGGMAFSTIVNR